MWATYRTMESRTNSDRMTTLSQNTELNHENNNNSQLNRILEENKQLRELIKLKDQRIEELTRLVQTFYSSSTPDIDSSEASCKSKQASTSSSSKKSMKVQMVTPTKRDSKKRNNVDTRGSTTSTSESTPTLSDVNRNAVRSIFVNRPVYSISTSSDSPAVSSPRRSTNNNSSPSDNDRTPIIQRNTVPRPSRQQQNANRPAITPLSRRLSTSNRRGAREQDQDIAVEYFGSAENADRVGWNLSTPPRVYLEANRPDLIARINRRQEIISTASDIRAQLEQKKRDDAREYLMGRKAWEEVKKSVLMDTTKVKAFRTEEIREQSKRNYLKSTDYRSRIQPGLEEVDRAANRLLADVYSQRTEYYNQRRNPIRT